MSIEQGPLRRAFSLLATTRKKNAEQLVLRKQGELASQVASRLKTIEQAAEQWQAFLAEPPRRADVLASAR